MYSTANEKFRIDEEVVLYMDDSADNHVRMRELMPYGGTGVARWAIMADSAER